MHFNKIKWETFSQMHNNYILLLELLPFLPGKLMLPLTAVAAFFYIEMGFGTGGRSISASSSRTASNALVTFWTALVQKKYRKGIKYFLKLKWWYRSVMTLKSTLCYLQREQKFSIDLGNKMLSCFITSFFC